MSYDPHQSLRLALLLARSAYIQDPDLRTRAELDDAIREAGEGGLEPEQLSELAGVPLEVVRSLLEPEDLAG